MSILSECICNPSLEETLALIRKSSETRKVVKGIVLKLRALAGDVDLLGYDILSDELLRLAREIEAPIEAAIQEMKNE